MKLTVSWGNSKLGRIPNISLPPGKSCPAGVPCYRDGSCYALKAYKMYPNVRKAWDTNWALWRTSPTMYFQQLWLWLGKRKNPVKRFRFHVSGDIPDMEYYSFMCITAMTFKKTKFLCFTKQYGLANDPLRPKNLVLVVSRWPGWPCQDTKDTPTAWMHDPDYRDVYTPSNARKCPGSCATCSLCFSMKPGANVVFEKH